MPFYLPDQSASFQKLKHTFTGISLTDIQKNWTAFLHSCFHFFLLLIFPFYLMKDPISSNVIILLLNEYIILSKSKTQKNVACT